MRYLPFLLLGLFFTSCQQTSVSKLAPIPVSFQMEGPLYSGPNTAQATFPTEALVQSLQAQGLSLDKVQELRLTNIILTAGVDSLRFNNCSEVVLQVVSDKTPMSKVAVLNPVPADATQLTLNISTEQADLIKYLQTAPFTLVADLNLNNDQESGMTFKGDFTFEVAVTK